MNSREEIGRMLRSYLAQYPQEARRLQPFVEFADSHRGEALYDRKNSAGHITAGGLIVSRRTGRVLLLRHKQLGKWLQPGGHVVPSDASVLDAAYREILEETGIRADELSLLPLSDGEPAPADADSHYIPPCPAKGESEHYHHDLRFVFLYDGADDRVLIDRLESEGFRWITLEQLQAMPDFQRIAPKIQARLQREGIV